MYLLDTDVVSRTSPHSAGSTGPAEWMRRYGDRNSAGSAGPAEWMRRYGDRSYLSVISLGEMQDGLARLLERGAHRRAAALQAWVTLTLERFADRIIPLDLRIAQRTGDLLARAQARGHGPGFEDACLAATADCHGTIVMTYNTRHFRALGVPFRKTGADEMES